VNRFASVVDFARRHPAFVRYQIARFCAVVGWNVMSTAVQWLVFERTRDPLKSGFVGLAQFVPLLLMALVGGVVADRFDRRRVVTVCHAALVAIALYIVHLASRPVLREPELYTALVMLGVVRAFTGPASQAIVPSLVPRSEFNRAVALASVALNIATLVGPSAGGVVYGYFAGHHVPEHTFSVCAVAFALATGLLATLPALRADDAVARENDEPRADGARLDKGPRAVLEGLRYVWTHKAVLGAISLDLFAVLLGGAVALLPFFASDILHAGPVAFGFLRSAPAVGATLMAGFLTVLPIRRHAGRIMFASVLVFGLATVVFGLSRSAVLSTAALFVIGASDMVSVQIRHTLVQLQTPDAMRGRVSAVNMVFITASNEFGEFESGVTAKWLGPVWAAIAGGVGSCVVVFVCAFLFPDLLRFENVDAQPDPARKG
jgi:MFS family permease